MAGNSSNVPSCARAANKVENLARLHGTKSGRLTDRIKLIHDPFQYIETKYSSNAAAIKRQQTQSILVNKACCLVMLRAERSVHGRMLTCAELALRRSWNSETTAESHCIATATNKVRKWPQVAHVTARQWWLRLLPADHTILSRWRS
jgi:hypothetical protein